MEAQERTSLLCAPPPTLYAQAVPLTNANHLGRNETEKYSGENQWNWFAAFFLNC